MVTYILNNIKLFLLVISLFNLNAQNLKNNGNKKILNYYLDNKIYSIEKNENKFNIIIKHIIYCFKAPCNPPIVGIKSINDEEDCKNLKSLFEQTFKFQSNNEITMTDSSLTDSQKKIILKVLYNNKILSKIEYEIINIKDNYNMKYSTRGYLYEIENDKSIIYTIALGEKPTGGYSIDIKKVQIRGSSVIVYISERMPGTGEIVTDALTYPIIKIKFNHIPRNIKIINYNDYEDRFKCLTK